MVEGWMQCLLPVLEKDKCSSSEKKRPPSVVVKWDGGSRELCRCFENRPGQADADTVPIQCGARSLRGFSQAWQKAGIGRQKLGLVNLEADPLSATTTTKHRSPEVEAAPSSPATTQLTRLCHGFELIQAAGPPGVGKVRRDPPTCSRRTQLTNLSSSSWTSVSQDLSQVLQAGPEVSSPPYLPLRRDIETLTTLAQSDTSRQSAVELEIQKRVAAELQKLHAEESEALKKTVSEVLAQAPKDGPKEQHTSHTVSKEIEALRAKLQERRQVRELPEGVEAARSEVVRCLRENDRRPLDCWKEVENFKEQVRRVEKGWVDKVIS